MAKKKMDLAAITEELAELQAEKANTAARIAELEQRLDSGELTVKELRITADELAEARSYMAALDRRLPALSNQRREIEEAERRARLVVLHEKEREAYAEYMAALRDLADGPQAAYLAAVRAVTDARGGATTGASNVIKAVVKQLRIDQQKRTLAARKAGGK